MPAIETEIKTGEPILAGDVELTPLTRVLKIQVPGYHAGLIWNRPKAVIVKTLDGHETTLPVIDVTRIAIWAMLAGGLLGAMIIGLLSRKK
jgi:hypothetical protein